MFLLTAALTVSASAMPKIVWPDETTAGLGSSFPEPVPVRLRACFSSVFLTQRLPATHSHQFWPS
jgi:hypothetical protein